MYVHFLLGLGGPVGAAEEDDAPAPTAPEAAGVAPRPSAEPRPGYPAGGARHRCCWRRAPGLRA